MQRTTLGLLLTSLVACSEARAQQFALDARSLPSPDAVAAVAPSQPAVEPDGNDDHEELGEGSLPASLTARSLGRAPGGLHRICDLTVFREALYVAASNQPLGSDGAVIARYQPGATRSGWSTAFDWNRPGQPTRGGGGGQGFLRVRAIGDRLYVPDSDSPYNGFGISEGGTEGFVFVSDAEGRFAAARGPNLRPPAAPNAQGYFGAGVLPRAYHVLDVIRFRGGVYASTGSVPPRERAWYGPSPGALHRADERGRRWTYTVDYPFPWQNGVWRLTYMTRFRGRLYAGIQDYDGREPNDYVVISPPAGNTELAREHVAGYRVSDHGAALTLRWYTDRGRLFWLTIERTGATPLRFTEDGRRWRAVSFPASAGRVSDVVRFRDALVALTEGGLYRLSDPADAALPTLIAAAPQFNRGRAFPVNDAFCASPLAVFQNRLYAGSQHDATLFVFE
ncbi:MAG: hypothetical protein U0269_17180 [Polyangiales bacterium]